MNLKRLLIIWINYNREMSGEDTRLERGAIHASSDFNLTLLEHEYGHYLQALNYGEFTYNNIIVPQSFLNATFDHDGHDNFWTEKDANAWATWYFGNDSAIGKDSDFPKEFSSYMNRIINK